MASISQPVTGSGFFGIPTIAISESTGRFVAFSEGIKHMMLEAAADGINEVANDIAKESLVEVPREDDDLADSILYPGNDSASRATAEDLEATVSYNTVYADVQHEGVWTMVHKHPIIHASKGFFFEKEGEGAAIQIEWRAEHYTVPGTKSHYLSDPMKANIPRMEAVIGAKIAARFGPLPIRVP